MDCGALYALMICLEEFDPGVKEAAAWALGYIARHNAGLLKYMLWCLTLKYWKWVDRSDKQTYFI